MKKKLKNKKTKMNKKHKMLKSNCPGVYWDTDKMAEELGWILTLEFIRQIEEDRKIHEMIWNNNHLGMDLPIKKAKTNKKLKVKKPTWKNSNWW